MALGEALAVMGRIPAGEYRLYGLAGGAGSGAPGGDRGGPELPLAAGGLGWLLKAEMDAASAAAGSRGGAAEESALQDATAAAQTAVAGLGSRRTTRPQAR